MSIITDPLFYMVAIPALIALGLSKGGFAGVGVIATPLTALYLPPLEAAALILPVLIVQDAISVWWYRRDFDPWNLKVMLPGALVGMALAWAFAAYVSNDALRISVGVIGIVFVIYSLFTKIPAEGHKKTALGGAFWGSVSGFTSFLSQAGGPPYQVHVLPQRLPKLTLVGTTTIFFAIVNFLKIGPYFALGQFSTVNFATSMVLLPVAVAANALGIYLVRVTPVEVFYRIAYTLVFCVSVMLLWQGITGLMRG
ncbi:sulfite exporter TauE/SafE family protein [Pseudorhodoplanes sp.]|uniref:sulfite exporter TauE/SafE family protein n=1 Tax=Pseudorhodoplanes sp. TaxID=1934341 RepID=UPI002C7D9D9A|nr:sulfite exporter TauE/SafE family protein [Pseudorhodoplanes sp.]HWV54570.1 sulfite exporter TauE/SafE family protein [Pseudorhodoplanes sp.]